MQYTKWDHEADLIVVGSGAAAYSSAITAKNKGLDVIMVEKGSQYGGTTLRSGGGFWIPNNRFQKAKGIVDKKEDAIRYMIRYSFPHLYNPDAANFGIPDNEYNLINAYCDKASEMTEYFERIGAIETIQDINWTGQPQVDYMDHLPENKGIRGRLLFTTTTDGKMGYGGDLIRHLKNWVDENGIPLIMNHRANKILINQGGEVIGIAAINEKNEIVNFRAKKAVFFGSGGYTHNKNLILHFQRGPHFGGCAAPTNTGDFIYMAGEIGAQLGNMAGAWRAQTVFEEVLRDPGGVHNIFFVAGDSVLEVNKYGQRIMDEKRNYSDRTMLHFVWDPVKAEWKNMLLFMIFDKRTADLWQGFPPYPPAGIKVDYVIEGGSLEELAKNIEVRLEKLKSNTGSFQLDDEFAENIKKTVMQFNQYASDGDDKEFSRGKFNYDREWTSFPPTTPNVKWPEDKNKNYTMYPLSETGPFYAVILSAGTLDTNGGPIINHLAQIIDNMNKPIAGLYGAGNCVAAAAANAYWGGGATIGSALTFGFIAGNEISSLKDNSE